MFEPRFSYTDQMIGLLTRIAAAREIILGAPLVPRWEISLRREAIVRSAHSSTSIEGNNLSLEQVSDLAAGRKIMARRKDKEEVLNYIQVLEKLDTLSTNGEIAEANIKDIQKLLTLNAIDDPRDCGAYRSETNKYVVVGNRLTGEISFRPPVNDEISQLMKDYVEWLNSDKAHGLDPVIMAGIAHYEFVRIHPFVDGNGRTARVIAALLLCLRGFDAKRFFCLDDYYDMDRPEYYRALRAVHPQERDLTHWLEYFAEGVAVSIDAVRERVVRLSTGRAKTGKKGQIALTERQMRIVESINKQGKMNVSDVAAMFKISRQAALKEIGKLILLEIVRREGQARASYYVMR
jgi:Fic family protein